ncbi:MAG: hypothetical protein HY273_07075 [Gammaproteobacteria bacterium]|nr:hypothetical protein [Gammaproteobacteria bacterium]
MRKGNSPSAQQELATKLRKVQTLINDCLDLVTQHQQIPNRHPKPSGQIRNSDTSVHFEMNERAFIKRYAKKLGSGPKKFVLILACLAKGNTSKEIPLNEIEKLWNRTSSKTLLAMKFNRFFAATAKENGWVDSKKRGFYNLDRSWKDIFIDD